MKNLKPCPFCGGTPFLYVKPIRGYKGHYSYRVLCTNCAAYVPIGVVHDLYMDAELAEQIATAAWNRRVNDETDCLDGDAEVVSMRFDEWRHTLFCGLWYSEALG